MEKKNDVFCLGLMDSDTKQVFSTLIAEFLTKDVAENIISYVSFNFYEGSFVEISNDQVENGIVPAVLCKCDPFYGIVSLWICLDIDNDHFSSIFSYNSNFRSFSFVLDPCPVLSLENRADSNMKTFDCKIVSSVDDSVIYSIFRNPDFWKNSMSKSGRSNFRIEDYLNIAFVPSVSKIFKLPSLQLFRWGRTFSFELGVLFYLLQSNISGSLPVELFHNSFWYPALVKHVYLSRLGLQFKFELFCLYSPSIDFMDAEIKDSINSQDLNISNCVILMDIRQIFHFKPRETKERFYFAKSFDVLVPVFLYETGSLLQLASPNNFLSWKLFTKLCSYGDIIIIENLKYIVTRTSKLKLFLFPYIKTSKALMQETFLDLSQERSDILFFKILKDTKNLPRLFEAM